MEMEGGQIESMGLVYEGVSCSISNEGMECSSVDSSTQPHDADSSVSNLESSDFEVILGGSSTYSEGTDQEWISTEGRSVTKRGNPKRGISF